MATARPVKIQILNPDKFYKDFPSLRGRHHKPTSLATPFQDNPPKPYRFYNCFAFAVGDRRRWWWPIDGYWPQDYSPGEESIQHFADVLSGVFGYSECDNGDFEQGMQKVAIFALNETPTHVALQPSSGGGKWKSKIGENVDMEHDLYAIEGPCYGKVVKFMKRTATWTPPKRRRR